MANNVPETWYLSNAFFSCLLQNGRLRSLQKTDDPLHTEFAAEKQGFGDLTLRFKIEEKEMECRFSKLEGLKTIPPVNIRGGLETSVSAGVNGLEIQNRFFLKNDKLEQTVTVKNISETAVTLNDLGVVQVCDSHFDWGCDASAKVIGHHYIGGHGAHSSWYRVDGNGPCLIFAPAKETILCFCDTSVALEDAGVDADAPEKGLTVLYPLAGTRAARALDAGAKLRVPQGKPVVLACGEEAVFHFRYFFADSSEKAPAKFAEKGLLHVESFPGYTVPRDRKVLLYLDSCYEDLGVDEENSDKGDTITCLGRKGRGWLYALNWHTLGEHHVTVRYDQEQKYAILSYFVTEAVETLWKKRAAFIASKQEKDPDKWYQGLLCEWNNATGVRLSPDNYDNIRGWRIYEVSCDDPGFSKPAFLSSKQTILPVQDEVDALDLYLGKFVWGGLQQTDEEPYPFGIYGIPDWKTLRESKDPGNRGRLHIWRVYDYPHIALTWYNMYKTAKNFPQIHTALPKAEYLRRAYGTACALFTIPLELEDWSAFKTGFYNELVIPEMIQSLREEGKDFEADRLHRFWERKAKFFAVECKDVFGSEYPFDTTGFESTYVLAKEALKEATAKQDLSPFAEQIPLDKAVRFMENQHRCNKACRGILEPVYYGYGSDYRGNNTHYLLSYMSAMGGCSILNHALYEEADPFADLRLGYGSLLSSYALLNTGDEESGYGYWYPGKEHDGAAGGGFEPLFAGETWLQQPHHGGCWTYSCEIDLGFAGAFRGACTVAAEDPIFGFVVYGGTEEKTKDGTCIHAEDGRRQSFHVLRDGKKFHAVLEGGRFAPDVEAMLEKDARTIHLYFEPGRSGVVRTLTLSTDGSAEVSAEVQEERKSGERLELTLEKDCTEFVVYLR